MKLAHIQSLFAATALSALGICSVPSAQNSSKQSQPLTTIATAVRIYPRAGFAAQMVGGEIQGSNQSATSGFTTLARIDKAPSEGAWTRIALKNAQQYRFLRYFGPTGSYSTVAEIEFWSGDRKIDGTPYGTFGSRDNNGSDYSKAFDSDTTTFFDAAAPNAQYLGIDVRSGSVAKTSIAPVVVGNGLRHYHIGNSLMDGMDQYTRELALVAGFKDDWADRQTIPGAPLWMNYQSDGGFGTNHKIAFEKFAPISDLVMQTFISNSDSEDPEFSLKFYDDARVKSPNIRPWIYGQWEATGSDRPGSGSPFWEAQNRALMRIYMAHALNFNAATKGRKTEVIPGGLALLNLKSAIESGKIPGQTNFYTAIFSDGLHLTESGRQFISMVIFASLYNRSPVGLPVVKIEGSKPPEITPAQNRIYQQIAWDTVQTFRRDSGAALASPIAREIDALSFIGGEVPVRHSRLGQLEKGRSFQYLVNAPGAGKYEIKVSAFTEKPGGMVEVSVNHKSAGEVTITPGKKSLPADSTGLSIDLKAGLNTVLLRAPEKSPYQLNSIKITPSGQALKNTLPLFDLQAWDEQIKPGETSFVRNFRVSDAETPADKLRISALSDKPALVTDANIKIERGEFKDEWGGVYNRRIMVKPAAKQSGEAWIVLTLVDTEGAERQQRFRIKVK